MGKVDRKMETQRKNEEEMLKKFCKNAFNEFIRKLEIAEKRMKEYGDRSIETYYIEMQREKEIKFFKKQNIQEL